MFIRQGNSADIIGSLAPVYLVHTTLEAIVEFALSSTTCEYLSFDDQVIGA